MNAIAALPLLLALFALSSASRFPPDAYFNPHDASMCVSTPSRVRAVFENHFRQLNRCSISGLKRERTAATQLYFGASNIREVRKVDAVFTNFCRARKNGGLRGLRFFEEKAFIVGNVISVQWVARAQFLKRDYRGSDAYVTCGGKMLTIVSTFNERDLQFRY